MANNANLQIFSFIIICIFRVFDGIANNFNNNKNAYYHKAYKKH